MTASEYIKNRVKYIRNTLFAAAFQNITLPYDVIKLQMVAMVMVDMLVPVSQG